MILRIYPNSHFSINADEKLEFKGTPDEHRFPIVTVGEDKCLVVEVKSLPRSTLHLPDSNPGANLQLLIRV